MVAFYRDWRGHSRHDHSRHHPPRTQHTAKAGASGLPPQHQPYCLRVAPSQCPIAGRAAMKKPKPSAPKTKPKRKNPLEWRNKRWQRAVVKAGKALQGGWRK